MGNVSMKSLATGNRVIRAYNRAVGHLIKEGDKLVKATKSAGVAPDGTDDKDTCLQVFVTVVRFSEKRLKEDPDSGGLACSV